MDCNSGVGMVCPDWTGDLLIHVLFITEANEIHGKLTRRKLDTPLPLFFSRNR